MAKGSDEQQSLFGPPRYGRRFIEHYGGQIVRDPLTALVELIANAWDAYATNVVIDWPVGRGKVVVRDNGIGLTVQEFDQRFNTFNYDRSITQGLEVAPPEWVSAPNTRKVHGRNGVGRFAAFHFGDEFRAVMATGGRKWQVEVQANRIGTSPFNIHLIADEASEEHGFTVICGNEYRPRFSEGELRAFLSTRFTADPNFVITVNGVPVTFEHIPKGALHELTIDVPDVGVVKIDRVLTERSDRTTKQHGVAWRVNGRLVGSCSWKNLLNDTIIDGRREEAKRLTFVVYADHLDDSVRADWSWFKDDDQAWIRTRDAVESVIIDNLSNFSKERRDEIKAEWVRENEQKTSSLSPIERIELSYRLEAVVEQCPNLGEKQLKQVMDLLATLELSESKYALIERLNNLSATELDEWNDVIQRWSVENAKSVLRTIEERILVLESIKTKAHDRSSDELHDIHPLVEKALWVFGPEFESVEYTSNVGMTRVIRDLLGASQTGSRNRPDFCVLPDSTVGLYSRPEFDEDGIELGVSSLVIIELKRPGVPLRSEEKNQVEKYWKELLRLGLISEHTKVRGYLLGDRGDPIDLRHRKEGDNFVVMPWLYNNFVSYGEKRMFNLKNRVQNSPFLQDFMRRDEEAQQDILAPLNI